VVNLLKSMRTRAGAARSLDREAGTSDGAAHLLDQAIQYQQRPGVLHEGTHEFAERYPGEFWAIRCDGVTKSFGANKVLDGLDFYIPEGMITVVLGPSGTGKSVLINQLIGLSFPDRGEVTVHGESLSKMTRARLADVRKEFGILFQDGALFGSLSVYDNVAFPLRQHTDLTEQEIEAKVIPRLADVGLAQHLDKMPNELSGGMRKRAGFARALTMDPSIVLFDEPDSGLDPVRTALLCELISETHSQYGGTYVLITHDIASARQVGEFIAVLWQGQIVQAADASRMFESENPFVRQFLSRETTGPLGME
jgi:phospholipid/cholesterol/gamma-HCH transport system ATP-binding protein